MSNNFVEVLQQNLSLIRAELRAANNTGDIKPRIYASLMLGLRQLPVEVGGGLQSALPVEIIEVSPFAGGLEEVRTFEQRLSKLEAISWRMDTIQRNSQLMEANRFIVDKQFQARHYGIRGWVTDLREYVEERFR